MFHVKHWVLFVNPDEETGACINHALRLIAEYLVLYVFSLTCGKTLENFLFFQL